MIVSLPGLGASPRGGDALERHAETLQLMGEVPFQLVVWVLVAGR